MRLAILPFGLALLVAAPDVAAAPQKWPFELDPSVGADPGKLQSDLAAGDATLPPLRATGLDPVQVGSVSLWMWPDAKSLLLSAASSGPGFMTWPTAPSLCAKHAAFAIPTILTPSPSEACVEADRALRERLADLGACRDVEQPERYVLAYEPKVDLSVTATIEGLIGLAGEGLSHHEVPLNLLPADFPARVRTVITKLRHDALLGRVTSAKTRYLDALAFSNQHASCFDPAARSSLDIAIGGLTGELDAASVHLAKLDADGKTETAREAVCLAAQARKRLPLPFPSLTRAERELIAFWLGGTYWRMRGAGILPLGSTQQARFYFLQQPFARIGELTGGKDGADASFQIYLAIFEAWSEWQDMGLATGDKYGDLVGMSGRGHRQVRGAAQVLEPRGYDTSWLTTGGVQMGPCYFYSFENLYDYEYAANTSPPYGEFIKGFTSVGEFCSGASIALGFARTLLDGTPTQAPPVSACGARRCGDDGCGGSCGSCGAGESCREGACFTANGEPVPAPPHDPDDRIAPPTAAVDRSPSPRGAGCGCELVPATNLEGPLALMTLGAIAVGRRRRRDPLFTEDSRRSWWPVPNEDSRCRRRRKRSP
jgi:MYXO-CTERM domain-containing protein